MGTRLIRHFDIDGTELEPEYLELSDEEQYQEQIAEEMNGVHDRAILALKNWGSLTLAQKDTILKGLLKWALWKDGWLTLGIL